MRCCGSQRDMAYHPLTPMRSLIAPAPADPAADRTRRRLRPFLKWAGGKRQLLPQLRRFVPRAFNAYHEPFVGSGAMFFDLYASGQLTGKGVRLMDTNADLIGCYRAVMHDVEGVIQS